MAKITTLRFLAAAVLAAASISAVPAEAPPDRPITPAEIEAHIRFLSDDLLEGRAVGGRGIGIAALYQEACFRAFGLEPAFAGSFRQTFELRGCTPDPKPSLTFTENGETVSLRPSEDFVMHTFREDAPARVSAELVYAGYGIQAPERGWDDLKGMDVAGKILLVEINEPGNFPGGIFDGEAMTYYGRWVYKYEKAEELGAAGCLIIHNTKGAAYGWDVVRNGWSGEEFFLPDKPHPLFFRGWISGEAADRIIKASGRDRAALRAAAETGDFSPAALGISAEVGQKCVFRSVPATNVAGILRGSGKGADERFVVLSAHYDHLGMDLGRAGDQIFNGALDNCSASACVLALARYYRDAPVRPKATLVFLAATGEENLFLGSDYFARHMPFPAAATMADINFEMTGVWGETEDVYGIGASHSGLDEIAARAAKNLGFRYIEERNRELGYFFRSDQFSFAINGIPAVWVHEGIVSRGKDPAFVAEKSAAYKKTGYHQVDDEIQPDWDYSGTIQITAWAREIIALLDASPALPQFKPTSSFRRK
ncbi:MAG: M28 family peptidase [Candidatus Aminicenantales bacterium]